MNNNTDPNHQDLTPQQVDMFDNNSSYGYIKPFSQIQTNRLRLNMDSGVLIRPSLRFKPPSLDG